jgi:hypothetical protein
MPKVHVWADLGDDTFLAYKHEARRRGIAVESLVEEVVNRLLEELQREHKEGSDQPIIPS